VFVPFLVKLMGLTNRGNVNNPSSSLLVFFGRTARVYDGLSSTPGEKFCGKNFPEKLSRRVFPADPRSREMFHRASQTLKSLGANFLSNTFADQPVTSRQRSADSRLVFKNVFVRMCDLYRVQYKLPCVLMGILV